MFKLHPQLEKDCLQLGKFTLCQLLLMNDANYPWFILVPTSSDITEIFQLSRNEQQRLQAESSYLSAHLSKLFSADKMNIAAIGNLVPQLHIHHIARYRHDPCWPQPVWGALPPTPYTEKQREALLQKLRSFLSVNGDEPFIWQADT